MSFASLAAAGAVVCLLFLALLHVYWGFGGIWPARTPDRLGPMVVGTPPGTAMPPLIPCLVVAALLLTAAALVAVVAFTADPPFIARLGCISVCAVLTARGLGGYADGRLRPETRAQPFYALNRRIYSPLCLLLAASIALVLL